MKRTALFGGFAVAVAAVVGALHVMARAADEATEQKAPAAVKPDEKIPHYSKVDGEVSGTIKSVGSDTMNELMKQWGDGFKRLYPNVQVEVEGKGSGTAPPALISGTSNFGPMSREMKQKEIDDFEAKYGYKPTAIPTSVDVLAVYVNKDNPIKGLTLAQVDAIFSKTRKAGNDKDIATWGDLGLTGEWADKPISLYGRNSASGTYGFFKEHVLQNGDYKASVKEQPGSSAVVQAVGSEKYAMGYSGIGYKTADVKAVPLATTGDEFVPADADHAYNGEYPLTRFLFLYVNYKPDSQLDPLRREFIHYILSQEGQGDVVTCQYLPLPMKPLENAKKKIGLGAAN